VDSFAKGAYTTIGNYLMANYYDEKTQGFTFLN